MVQAKITKHGERKQCSTPVVILLTALSTICLLWNVTVTPVDNSIGQVTAPKSTSTSTSTSMGWNVHVAESESFHLCSKESQGFFTDISDQHWELMRERVRKRINHCIRHSHNFCPHEWKAQIGRAGAWYMDNYEPDFSCWHEKRIGGTGYGPKWVCDPYRIAQKGSDCLVYSFVIPTKPVSEQPDLVNLSFEEGVLKDISHECEIHVFMPGKEYESTALGTNNVVADANQVHYHGWGISSAPSENMKTMQQTVTELGHSGRTIDILKLDCKGCEFNSHEEFFSADVTIRQIAFTAHAAPGNVNDVFQKLQEEGYVMFHKEAVSKHGGGSGTSMDFGMVKLDASFFEGMNNLQVG
uniref:Methyltransferase domain-containing protein n=1 Tax=Leptocylindrus danicus TaxID=163516 RepID=A0A7S2KME4_9STRA|mmetsp:Transcript_24368/g.36477  ORF Transcript_24368/g.36477 Transcript_24368/m.36477 type:complete len:355 (+) Transcript_24368:27-1091(+)